MDRADQIPADILSDPRHLIPGPNTYADSQMVVAIDIYEGSRVNPLKKYDYPAPQKSALSWPASTQTCVRALLLR
jgi:hypothetical protein